MASFTVFCTFEFHALLALQGKLQRPALDVAGALVVAFLTAGEGSVTAGAAAGEVAFLAAGAGTAVDEVRGPTGKVLFPVAGDVAFPAAVVLAFVPAVEGTA